MVRFSEYADTSVANEISRSTDIDPTIANPPSINGSAAASNPPNTHTNTTKLNGIARDSINSRSRSFCWLIWS